MSSIRPSGDQGTGIEMMSSKRSLAWSLVIVLLGITPAWAWNDLGHITVAQIAFRQLSGDERHAVVEILRQHPHCDTYFKKPAGLEIPEDEWLFLRAATWCDFVRAPKDLDAEQIAMDPVFKFHRGPWHYINYPFQANGAIAEQLPAPLIAPDGEDTDIVRQLGRTRDVLKGILADDPGQAAGVTAAQNKAVRLCWLFHLIGDIHQPLHATALVDTQLFPGPNHGDAGGNFVFIRTNTKARPLNLHAYWDGVLGYVTGWRDGTDAAKLTSDISRCRTQADLLTHGRLAADQLSELQQHRESIEWSDESYRLAVAVAYDSGRLKFTTKKDVDDQRVQPDQVPLLPPVMQEKARAVANKRIALAGYRLASQLQDIVR